MDDIIWAVPFSKRQNFEMEFSKRVTSFVNSYNGTQPIMTWYSDRNLPEISSDFLKHLPDYIRDEIETLIKKLSE